MLNRAEHAKLRTISFTTKEDKITKINFYFAETWNVSGWSLKIWSANDSQSELELNLAEPNVVSQALNILQYWAQMNPINFS